MNVSTTIPPIVQIPRGRLLGLVAGIAALAAAITWAVLALAGETGDVARPSATAQSWSLPIPSMAVTRVSATQNTRAVRSLMDLTPGDLAGGGLGGYALPSHRSGQTLAEVFASMSPQTRRYTEAVMGMTFDQLAAGAAGYP